MLPVHLFSRNIRTQITLPYQWFNTIRLSSNSSSSDSSGSDSDSDLHNRDKQIKKATSNKSDIQDNKDEFNELINNLLNSNPSNSVDIKLNFKNKERKLEKHLTKAAETLTTAVGGDKEKILSTLLQGLSKIEKEGHSNIKEKGHPNTETEGHHSNAYKNKTVNQYGKKFISSENIRQIKEHAKLEEQNRARDKREFKKKYEKSANIQQLMMQAKLKNKHRTTDTTKFGNKYGTKETRNDKYRHKIEETWNNEYKHETIQTRIVETKFEQKDRTQGTEKNKSIIWMLLNDHKETLKQIRYEKHGLEEYTEIFCKTNMPSPSVCELQTWNACEVNEMKLLGTHYPENAFQEMIQWTDEGKLWKFPIDNEQGMEEEQNVHFSEHVFLERHLTGWCPTKGPIRHFMELVCIGLSKNPYMTVQEKFDHIMWYKEYFEDKNDLLQKLGIGEIGQPHTEKQIETE